MPPLNNNSTPPHIARDRHLGHKRQYMPIDSILKPPPKPTTHDDPPNAKMTIKNSPRPTDTPQHHRVPQKKLPQNTSHTQKSQWKPKHMKVVDHLHELKKRLIWCILSIVLGGIIGYFAQNQIISWLTKPLGQELFFFNPTGGFDFLIKICLLTGLLLSIPVIIYNIIRYIEPAMPNQIEVKIAKSLLVSLLLALIGLSFAYFVSLPAALFFLKGFSNAYIHSLISAQEYFDFVLLYLAGFAVLFQMPLIMLLANKIAPLSIKNLWDKQRIVLLVSFIIAAIITPTPDPMNQAIMALPIIILYQISIATVWWSGRRHKLKP